MRAFAPESAQGMSGQFGGDNAIGGKPRTKSNQEIQTEDFRER
jgi:hypothetical protein